MVKFHRTENLRNRSVPSITHIFPEMGNSQQCSQLSTDWGPGHGHREDVPWKQLLCGCSSLRGWAKGSLCYFLNKYCVLRWTNTLCYFLWDSFISSFFHVLSQGALHFGHCNAARWLLYCSVTWWVTGLLGLVSFGVLQAEQQISPSSQPVVMCAQLLGTIPRKTQYPVPSKLLWELSHLEAPTVTIPASDH